MDTYQVMYALCCFLQLMQHRSGSRHEMSEYSDDQLSHSAFEIIGLSRKGMSSVMLEQKLCGKSWLKICSSRWDCSLTPPPPLPNQKWKFNFAVTAVQPPPPPPPGGNWTGFAKKKFSFFSLRKSTEEKSLLPGKSVCWHRSQPI